LGVSEGSRLTGGVRLCADGKRPTQATAASFLSSAKGSPLASTLSNALAQAVEHGVAWADKARKALVKRNSGQHLQRGLKHLALSLDRARTQLARLQVRVSSDSA